VRSNGDGGKVERRLAYLSIMLCGLCAIAARAQMPFNVPAAAPPDGAHLFTNQCGTCHTVEHGAAPRQGPNLAGVVGRRAGTLPGFTYSPAFAHADFTWDDAHLDQWLTNPQAMLPGAVMVYRQANPATRQTIIAWLKEEH
jgi:cytochrome c